MTHTAEYVRAKILNSLLHNNRPMLISEFIFRCERGSSLCPDHVIRGALWTLIHDGVIKVTTAEDVPHRSNRDFYTYYSLDPLHTLAAL